MFRGIRDDIAPKRLHGGAPTAISPRPTTGDAAPDAPPDLAKRRRREAAPRARRSRHRCGPKVTQSRQGVLARRGLHEGRAHRLLHAIAPVLLPFLRDRPIVLVRYPDGIKGKNFYPVERAAGHAELGAHASIFPPTKTGTRSTRSSSTTWTGSRTS